MSVKNVLIVGVGGQGTLLASKVLGAALTASGAGVKVSEVHGMSQRGGSVVTYVRYDPDGGEVFSPVIEAGEADFIVSFELMEAARWLPYLKKGGRIIANSAKISPMPVIVGLCAYPDDLPGMIESHGAALTLVDASAIAGQAGSEKAVNIVLLGALSKLLGLPGEIWPEAIKASVPEKFLDINLKAFGMASA